MEKSINTPEKFRFPHYETVCWYAASRLVTELRDMALAGSKIPPFIISGARALMSSLRHWAGEVKSLKNVYLKFSLLFAEVLH